MLKRKQGTRPLRMGEQAASDVLLVRAIEQEDRDFSLLTRQDRQYATSGALGRAQIQGEAPGERETSLFLGTRAELALDRLIARYPLLQRARVLARWPSWLNWLLPLGALILGLATNGIEGRRLNILAFPLLGMLAWNLAVYAGLVLNWLRRKMIGNTRLARHDGPLIGWLLRRTSGHLAGHPTLERAVARFSRDWRSAAAPLTRARASRTLHLGAAMLALGVVIGMLARARYTAEYSAGWAGTWAGAEAEVAAFLRIVLAPASALTGLALPTAERLRELRGNVENAGDWLILWTVTATILIILPRLLLALGHAVQAIALRRRVEVPQDLYIRSLVRDAVGRPRTIRVLPYSLDLSAEGKETLSALLVEVFGARTRVQIDPSIAYGDEDAWGAAEGDRLQQADHLVLLFNLSSTPEAENHGALVSAVRAQAGAAAEVMVLLDDSSFIHKLRGQTSASRRRDERLEAWGAIVAPSGLSPITVTLDQPADPGAAQDLEQALLDGAARS